MRGKKADAEGNQPTIGAVDDSDDYRGALKRIGGSPSDKWNHVLANQAVQTLWLGNSNKEAGQRQCGATIAALIGIRPKDELEGMLAAQLLASTLRCHGVLPTGDDPRADI